jgi:hypothetical protein
MIFNLSNDKSTVFCELQSLLCSFKIFSTIDKREKFWEFMQKLIWEITVNNFNQM